MDPATHIAHLAGRRGRAARRRTATTRPPPCRPARRGTERRCSHHVAGVHSWVRAQVEHGPGERVRFKQSPQAAGGRRAAGLVRGQRRRAGRGPARAMDTDRHLAHVGRRPQPGSFYPRRMAQETAVHRWDGVGRTDRRRPWRSTASTSTSSCSPRWPRATQLTAHGTIHLHATDIDGEWLVTLGPEGHHLRARPRQGRRGAPGRGRGPAALGVEPGRRSTTASRCSATRALLDAVAHRRCVF